MQVWDAVRGKPSFTFTGHTDEVLYVAWSPDSTRLLVLARNGSESAPLAIFVVSASGNGFTQIH